MGNFYQMSTLQATFFNFSVFSSKQRSQTPQNHQIFVLEPTKTIKERQLQAYKKTLLVWESFSLRWTRDFGTAAKKSIVKWVAKRVKKLLVLYQHFEGSTNMLLGCV